MKKIIKLEIINLPIEQLQINTDNPRKIKSERLQKLADSLNGTPELFNARPCLCSNRTGVNIILGGNMRYLAAKKLKWKTVPAIIIPNLTIEQEQEITIKDNGDFGEWDFEQLANAWDHLPLVDWGVNLPEDWLNNNETEPNEQDDVIPEEPESIVIKKGDLIELGNHRLLCGDSTDKAQVEKLMNGKKADIVFTDPPFDFELGQNNYSKIFLEFTSCAHVFLMHDDKGMIDYLKNSDLEFCRFFVCDFKFSSPRGNDPYLQHILISHEKNGKAAPHKNMHDGLSSIIKIDYRGNLKDDITEHKHQKPLNLIEKFINHYSVEENIILDIFGGSGSSLIASEKTGRKCMIADIEEKNCQIIVQRWCDFTEKDCIKINGVEINWSGYK